MTQSHSTALAALCSRTLDGLKAENIVALDLRTVDSAPADFFLICSATSDVHARALNDALTRATVSVGERRPRSEGREVGDWVLLDYFDVVVHIFRTESREYYKLEKLWGDAPIVDFEKLEKEEREKAKTEKAVKAPKAKSSASKTTSGEKASTTKATATKTVKASAPKKAVGSKTSVVKTSAAKTIKATAASAEATPKKSAAKTTKTSVAKAPATKAKTATKAATTKTTTTKVASAKKSPRTKKAEE